MIWARQTPAELGSCRALPIPWPARTSHPSLQRSLADAQPQPFWPQTLPARDPHAPLERTREADLCIVGGGFTGLWAALYAKELEPRREVVVLEAGRCGSGASVRNGGFLNYSLTHGIANGMARFPDELAALERLGTANYDALLSDLGRHRISAELETTGELDVAVAPHQLAGLSEAQRLFEQFGQRAELLDAEALQAQIRSPLYLGGLWQRSGAALVNPAKLADGLRGAALRAGVEIHEHSRVRRLRKHGAGVEALTGTGAVRAERLLLATSAYAPLVPAIGRYVAPVYDYVLVSEPLGPERLAQLGWTGRQGVGDSGNRFHYYRLTADNRILWGGYDAVYRRGGPVGPEYDQHQATFRRLAANFFTNFPQLEGVRFSHRWGGAIDTCSRFSVFFGRALGGRAVYALGYTGLGVGASRFGARTGLDLLDRRTGEVTALRFVRRRPVPFPPEPLRQAVIGLTSNRLAAADRSGQRGLWLRTLDRFGVGFDS